MERKNNKKRLAILILLLVALVGVTGYGVYSYYYTQGSFNTQEASDESSDNVIRITGEFNPIVDGTGDSSSGNEFLGRGGSIDLDCPDSSGGHERIKCTAKVSNGNLTIPYQAAATTGYYTIDAWYPNYKYNYTVTIKKTGIDHITAAGVGWEEVTGDLGVIDLEN